MKKVIAALLISQVVLMPIQSYAQAELTLTKPIDRIPEKDCILSITSSDRLFKVVSKKGVEFSVNIDSLKRVELVKINNKTYRPTYDENIPTKVVSLRSVEEGVDVTLPNGARGVVPPEDKANLQRSINGLTKCAPPTKIAGGTNKLPGGVVTPTLAPNEDPGHGYGENWFPVQFYEMYTYDSYWNMEHEPYFDFARTASISSTIANCVDKAQSCSDACDTEGDIRNGVCAFGAAWFWEIPVGAALYAIACTGASTVQKYRCRSMCPQLSACF